jgi:hypothetical protein
MAAISLLLSMLGLFTIFLVIPIFILQPIATILGFKSYREFVRRNPNAAFVSRAIAALPLIIAIAVFVFGFWLLSTQYNV